MSSEKPSSVSSMDFKAFGMHQICLDLCKGLINQQVSDAKELIHLLPIAWIVSDWDMYTSVEWKNPITNVTYNYPIEIGDDLSKTMGINAVNEKIDEYNLQVEELDSQYSDLEERVKNQHYRKIDHLPRWAMTVFCEKRVHPLSFDFPPNKFQQYPLDTRHFNSEHLYKVLLGIDDDKEKVGRLNRTIYEYLKFLTDGKTLKEHSTLYHPLMEFEDYMMTHPEKYTHLVHMPKASLSNKYFIDNRENSPFRLIWKDKTYDFKEPLRYNNRPIFSELKDYEMEIDIEKETIKINIKKDIEWRESSGRKEIAATFKELKLRGRNGVHRYIDVLIRYGYYQEAVKDTPSQASQKWKDFVLADSKMGTLTKYQRDITPVLRYLLNLEEFAPVFEKIKIGDETHWEINIDIRIAKGAKYVQDNSGLGTISGLDTNKDIRISEGGEDLDERENDDDGEVVDIAKQDDYEAELMVRDMNRYDPDEDSDGGYDYESGKYEQD